jgi:hypothetical protein
MMTGNFLFAKKTLETTLCRSFKPIVARVFFMPFNPISDKYFLDKMENLFFDQIQTSSSAASSSFDIFDQLDNLMAK